MTDPNRFFVDGYRRRNLASQVINRTTYRRFRASNGPYQQEPDGQGALLPQLCALKDAVHLVNRKPVQDDRAKTVGDPFPEKPVKLRKELDTLGQVDLHAVDQPGPP